mgnify:CR=1 FL=1
MALVGGAPATFSLAPGDCFPAGDGIIAPFGISTIDPVNVRQKEDNISWRVGLNYSLDSGGLIYATAETWPELVQWPVLAGHLARFRPIMEARRETRQGLRPWWHLHWPRDGSLWESDKIVALQMARRPAFVPATGSGAWFRGRKTRSRRLRPAALPGRAAWSPVSRRGGEGW